MLSPKIYAIWIAPPPPNTPVIEYIFDFGRPGATAVKTFYFSVFITVHTKPLAMPHLAHLPQVGQPYYKHCLGEEQCKLPYMIMYVSEYSSKKILYVLYKEWVFEILCLSCLYF
jgi:hypothetical protein